MYCGSQRNDELGCGEAPERRGGFLGSVGTSLLLEAEETWQRFLQSQGLGYGDGPAVGPARNLYASPADRLGLKRICGVFLYPVWQEAALLCILDNKAECT